MRSFLGNEQRKELESDRDYFTKQLNNPLVQDMPMIRRNLQRVERDIETQAPPDLSHPSKGPELDKVVRREKELREEIVPNMLSQAEMRQAPPGSVGREMAFQKRYKHKIIEWKNCRRTIHRDSEDPDVANLECFRPTVPKGNLDNAFIPGKNFNFASPQYQEKHEDINWHQSDAGAEFETPESRERREKLAALRAELATLEAEKSPETEDAPSRLGLEEG
ncbi:MAG: hypothetical protein ACYTBJ_12520 [Planctomycetota bacterium]